MPVYDPDEQPPQLTRKKEGPSRRGEKVGAPHGPPQASYSTSLRSGTRSRHDKRQGLLDSKSRGRKGIQGKPRPQDVSRRQNSRSGPTAEEADDQAAGRVMGDEECEDDQEPDALAEQYGKQTREMLIPPHEPL